MALFDVQKALSAGMTPDEISVYMTQNKLKSLQSLPAAPTKKKRSGLASLLPLIGGITGGVLGAPLGPAGMIGGSALLGGLGEFGAQKLSGEDTNLGAIGKEAAFSGISGGVGMGALKLLGRGAKPVLSGIGNELTQGTIRSGIGAGATSTPDDITKIAAFASKYGITGSPVAQAVKANSTKPIIKQKLLDLLKSSPELPRIELRQQLEQKMLGSVQGSDNPAAMKRAVTHYLGMFDKAKPGNKGLLELRDQLYPLTQSKSALPSARSAAVNEMYDGINQVLGGTSGKAAVLLEDQALAHQATKVFSTTASKGTNIPFLGSSQLASRPVGALRNLMARATSGLGSQAPRGMLGQTATTGAQQLTGRGILGMAGVGGQPQDQGIDQSMGGQDMQSLLSQASGTQADTGMPSQTNEGQDMAKKLKTAALLDLMQGGKNVTKLLALSKSFEGQGGDANTRKKLGQLDQAETIITEFAQRALMMNPPENATAARAKGLGVKIATPIGLNTAEQKAYNTNRLALRVILARSLGEVGNLSEPEQRAALDMIPDIGDSREEVELKSAGLISLIRKLKEDVEGRSIQTSSGGDDLLSLLGAE